MSNFPTYHLERALKTFFDENYKKEVKGVDLGLGNKSYNDGIIATCKTALYATLEDRCYWLPTRVIRGDQRDDNRVIAAIDDVVEGWKT